MDTSQWLCLDCYFDRATAALRRAHPEQLHPCAHHARRVSVVHWRERWLCLDCYTTAALRRARFERTGQQ